MIKRIFTDASNADVTIYDEAIATYYDVHRASGKGRLSRKAPIDKIAHIKRCKACLLFLRTHSKKCKSGAALLRAIRGKI